jgi:hypothetical protein
MEPDADSGREPWRGRILVVRFCAGFLLLAGASAILRCYSRLKQVNRS